MIPYVLLAAVATLAFAIPFAVGVVQPNRLALAALFIAAPLEVYRTEAAIGNVSVFRLVLAVAAIVAVRERRHELVRLGRQPITLSAAALLIVMALSLLVFSENRSLGLAVLGQAAVVLVAALTTAALAHGVALRTIVRLASLAVILPALAAAAQGFYAHTGESFGLPLVSQLPVDEGLEVTRADALYLGRDGIRLKGTFGDPNHFAVWLVFMLAVSIASAPAWLRAGRITSVAGLIWCAGILTVLLATYSRTGWLCATVTALVALIVVATSASARAVLRTRRRWAIATILICVVAVAPLTPKIALRLDNDRSANRVSNESHARTTHVAFEEFAAHPLTGIGLSDLGPRLGQLRRTSGAHSSFLTIASELGLPGVLAMIAVFFLVARALWRASSRRLEDNLARVALLCAYLGFVVANAFYDLFWDDFHWLVVGVALAAAAGCAPPVDRAADPPGDGRHVNADPVTLA